MEYIYIYNWTSVNFDNFPTIIKFLNIEYVNELINIDKWMEFYGSKHLKSLRLNLDEEKVPMKIIVNGLKFLNKYKINLINHEYNLKY